MLAKHKILKCTLFREVVISFRRTEDCTFGNLSFGISFFKPKNVKYVLSHCSILSRSRQCKKC